MNDEARIEIESIEIGNGEIIMVGSVEGQPFVYRLDESMKDYEKFLPDVANIESMVKGTLYELYLETQ